eukprot:scaffold136448_cov40-Tisochrysis_lutea.AAC.2
MCPANDLLFSSSFQHTIAQNDRALALLADLCAQLNTDGVLHVGDLVSLAIVLTNNLTSARLPACYRSRTECAALRFSTVLTPSSPR